MNILILQASPRAKGDTAWMADVYKEAAEDSGIVAAKVDEQKTDETKQKIIDIVKNR